MSLYSDPIDTHGHTVKDVIDAYDDAQLAVGTEVTLSNPSAAVDDIIDTATAHGFVAGQPLVFTEKTGGAGLNVDQVYYVIAANLAAQTLQVSATPGGSAVNFTTDITAGKIAPLAIRSAGAGATGGDLYLAQSTGEVNAQIG